VGLGDSEWDWNLIPVCQSVVEFGVIGCCSDTGAYPNYSQLFKILPSITKLVVEDRRFCPIAWKSLDPSHLPNLRVFKCKTSRPADTPAGLFENVEKLVIANVKLTIIN
jgi:hypothetical protein